MYLFIFSDGEVLKYKVEFDRERILDIKKNILMNCCLLKRNRVTTGVPKAFEDNPNYIINFSKEINNTGLYSLDYYEIIYPNILKLIDRLLMGDTTIIVEIEAYTDEREYPKDKVDRLFSELDSIDSSNKKALNKKIYEIKSAMDSVSINEKEQRVDNYVNELRNSIRLTLSSKMSIRDMYKFFNFVGEDIEEVFMKKLV